MNKLVLILLFLSSSIIRAQDSLNPFLAHHFAKSGFSDSRIFPIIRNVFILNEDNIHTLIAYQNIMKDGYINMVPTDTVPCCLIFDIYPLPKAQPFILDSVRNEQKDGYDPLIQTLAYDSLTVTKITKIDNYFEIKYTVYNIRPTPFHINYYSAPEQVKKAMEANVIYVKQVNGTWQIDHKPTFYGFETE